MTTASAPSNVTGDKTDPISTLTSNDLAIQDIVDEFPNNNSTASGYAGYYQLRLKTATGSSISAGYDVADISVNAANNTYTLAYGATTPPVSPPPALPEATYAVGLPLIALLAGGGVVAVRRRRRVAQPA